MLKVLRIPSWYPTEEDPLMGFFFREQALALRNEGCEVGVVYPEIRPLKNFKLRLFCKNYFQVTHRIDEGIPTYRLHGWNIFPRMEKTQMSAWVHSACALADRYVRERGVPDILHAHSAIWGGAAARAISKKFNIPYIITEHRSNFLQKKIVTKPIEECWSTPLIQDTLDNASQTIAVSMALKKAMAPYMRTPAASPVVLGDPVDTSFLTIPETPPEIKPFRYFCLAKLVSGKNIDLLLRSFKDLLGKGRDILLEIGGFGDDQVRLEKLALHLGLTGKVKFLGKLSREQVREAYHRTHAFVLASDFETFGVVYIEAMACGLPVIATRCGGPEDIVSEETGLLVDVNDQNGLAKAMTFLMDNIQKYKPKTIRQWALDHFSLSANTQKILQIYDRVI